MTTKPLSPSTLNLLLDCSRCFWLQEVKGVRRPQGPMASIAVGLDSVLKKYCDAFREKGLMPPLWKGKVPGKLAFPRPKTLKWEDPDTGLVLKGLLDDCLEIKKNVFAPLDHKTRASAPKEPHPSYKVQMDVYAFLLEKNGFKTDGRAFLIYYYPRLGRGEFHQGIPFETTVVELKTNRARTLALLKQAKTVLDKKEIPKPSEKCQFCAWNDVKF